MTAAIFGTVPAFCARVMPEAAGREAERQLTIMFRSMAEPERAAKVMNHAASRERLGSSAKAVALSPAPPNAKKRSQWEGHRPGRCEMAAPEFWQAPVKCGLRISGDTHALPPMRSRVPWPMPYGTSDLTRTEL
jgi:hypothetical protein